MADSKNNSDESLQIARHWCENKGKGWSVGSSLGAGGTAPVFEVVTPDGPRALKIYDARFSSGKKGDVEYKRIEQQLELKGHHCPYLVQIYEGGKTEGRLFLLMGRAPGQELEKRLKDVPRDKIRQIVDQVARAAIFLRGKGLCHRDIKAANVFISDDFDHCTLLDISVIRNVTDPIGVGTDHEGQLPVVATARYSPPEYLFRLLEPSNVLWHALNVYQLGALLHDLIMREPLFEAEYQKSRENRYRFAWIAATVDPMVQADDVDRDLMLTAHRALDKNWQRRSMLTLEGFLADEVVHKTNALQILGVFLDRRSIQETDDLTKRLQRVREVASDLQNSFTEHLRKNGVTAIHEDSPGPQDTSRQMAFKWTAPAELTPTPPKIELHIELQLLSQGPAHRLAPRVRLQMQHDGKTQSVEMALPELADEPEVAQRLLGNVVDAFAQLAMDITKGSGKTGKD